MRFYAIYRTNPFLFIYWGICLRNHSRKLPSSRNVEVVRSINCPIGQVSGRPTVLQLSKLNLSHCFLILYSLVPFAFMIVSPFLNAIIYNEGRRDDVLIATGLNFGFGIFLPVVWYFIKENTGRRDFSYGVLILGIIISCIFGKIFYKSKTSVDKLIYPDNSCPY